MKKNTVKFTDILYIIFSCTVFSLGYNLFLNPHSIIPGGVTGIAMIANRLYPSLSVGSYVLLVNLPLVLIALKMLGSSFVVRSGLGTAISGVFLDLFSFLPSAVDDPLIAALFGGGMVGASLGLLYQRGYNTGGSDLLVFIIRKRSPHFSSGKIVLASDSTVVILTAIIQKNFSLIFVSVIAIITESALIDRLSSGPKGGKLVFVFSEQYEELAKQISKNLSRGVTLVDSTGWFYQKSGKVLLCAVRTKEVYRLKAIIKQIDPVAFAVFTEAGSISGTGFDLL